MTSGTVAGRAVSPLALSGFSTRVPFALLVPNAIPLNTSPNSSLRVAEPLFPYVGVVLSYFLFSFHTCHPKHVGVLCFQYQLRGLRATVDSHRVSSEGRNLGTRHGSGV